MSTDTNNPFAWRSQGKRFDMGDSGNPGISAMINIDDSLLIVTRNSINKLLLADSVDPERTNPAIPDSKQEILSYGSDEPFVGRTLLQAQALLVGQGLPNTIDSKKGLYIGFSFLKEIASLHELVNDCLSEEKDKNALFNRRLETDQSLQIPLIPRLEQKTKQFLNNLDHATSHIVELVQLFYPDINKKGWVEQLQTKLKEEKGDEDPSTKFVQEITPFITLVRSLRNATEHPKPNDKVEIKNYSINKNGQVQPPTILYTNTKDPFPEVLISKFMSNMFESLQTCFELLMAHLCSVHVKPFADMNRLVIEVPKDKRLSNEMHVSFKYQIFLRK